MPVLASIRRGAAYLWDRTKRLFRSAPDRQPVEPRTVRYALDNVLDAGANRLRNLSGQLARGDLSTAGWVEGVRSELTSLHLAARLAAVGGIEQLTPEHTEAVSATLAGQFGYLDRFAGQVDAGDADPASDGFAERTASYADAARTLSYEAPRREQEQAGGARFECRQLDPDAEHCDGCRAAADDGWVPFGTGPAIGTLQCGQRCRCQVIYSTAETSPDDADFGAAAVVRTEAVEFWSPDQPRDERGRWTSGGTTHLEAARGHIADIQVSLGGTTPAKIQALHDTLAKLTVAQLRGLKQEFGLKASGPRKAELVAKVHARLLSGHGSGPPAAAAGQQAPARRSVPPLSQIARANPIPDEPPPLAPIKVPAKASAKAPPEPSKATVDVHHLGNPEAVHSLVGQLLGPGAKLQDVAGLVGAPDDARVLVDAPFRTHLTVRVVGPGYWATRTIGPDFRGDKYISNDEIEIDEAHRGKGLGTSILARQVEHAAAHEFRYLECYAAKGPKFNGYYTWPRMGYDLEIPIPPGERPAEFRGARMMSDLMQTKAGRDWWYANGEALRHARFDLAEGSLSRRVLDAYRAERARRGDA